MASADLRAQDIITCDLCSSPVELYCNPCQVNLCAVCSPKHMRSKISKKHNVVLYRERLLESVHSECASHAEQECTMFCKTCDCPICVKCVTTSHKKHDFIDIEEKIVSSMKVTIEADTKELEDAIIPTYESIQFEIGEKKSDLHREYDEVQINIDENGIKWHKEIDIVIQKQKTEAKQMKDRNLKTLNKHQTEMQDILSLARDVLKRNKGLLSSNNVTEIKNYKSRNDELRTVPQRINWTIPSFTPILIQGEYLYRQFGKLNDAIESEIAEFKMKQLTIPEVDIECQVRTKLFTGLSYLPVDKIWVHGIKNTIDLIDIEGTVLDTVKTLSGEKPQGLIVTKGGHLLYGDYSVGNINMVKNGQTSTVITLPPGWTLHNMCFALSDDLLIVMCNAQTDECKVVRYDKDYSVKQEIQCDDKGVPLFKEGIRRIYIAENKNTDICVSNMNTNNVITVNQSGKLRWRYTGNLDAHKSDCFDPQGIATDSQYHVLVASPKSNCVHVIDKDGRFLFFIEKCGFSCPNVLCVDNDDRLFVGETESRSKSECKMKIIRYLK